MAIWQHLFRIVAKTKMTLEDILPRSLTASLPLKNDGKGRYQLPGKPPKVPEVMPDLFSHIYLEPCCRFKLRVPKQLMPVL